MFAYEFTWIWPILHLDYSASSLFSLYPNLTLTSSRALTDCNRVSWYCFSLCWTNPKGWFSCDLGLYFETLFILIVKWCHSFHSVLLFVLMCHSLHLCSLCLHSVFPVISYTLWSPSLLWKILLFPNICHFFLVCLFLSVLTLLSLCVCPLSWFRGTADSSPTEDVCQSPPQPSSDA